jgi:hypothetical protein
MKNRADKEARREGTTDKRKNIQKQLGGLFRHFYILIVLEVIL